MKLLASFRRPKKSVNENAVKFYSPSSTCQISCLDVYYRSYFGETQNGCFIEIGAFDGEAFSNTSCLADLGWKGFYIEPVPQYYNACKQRHARNPNVTVSQLAIGSTSEEIEIYLGGPLSTSDKRARDSFESLDWAKDTLSSKTVVAEQILLEDYLLQHGIKPQFDLMVIDIEGSEWDALRNWDISKWMPKMVIIELHDQSLDYPLLKESCQKVVGYFERHNYKIVYKDLTNTIYISPELHSHR